MYIYIYICIYVYTCMYRHIEKYKTHLQWYPLPSMFLFYQGSAIRPTELVKAVRTTANRGLFNE